MITGKKTFAEIVEGSYRPIVSPDEPRSTSKNKPLPLLIVQPHIIYIEDYPGMFCEKHLV